MKKRCFYLIIIFILIISVFVYFDNKKEYLSTDNIIGIYINDELNEKIPTKESAKFQKAVCDDENVKVSWDNDNWGLLISNLNKKVKCNLYFYSGPTVFDYDYIGDVQEFSVPVSGIYKVELWGASGGDVTIDDVNYQGGLGGYTSGIINLAKNQFLYVYVGGSTSSYVGGYNGGADCGDGFYGGGAGRTAYGAGGGSGYIGNSLLTNKVMYCYNCEESNEESTKTISTTCNEETPTSYCAKKGNGYARITLVSIEE